MKRKLIRFCLFIILVASLLSGCNSSDKKNMEVDHNANSKVNTKETEKLETKIVKVDENTYCPAVLHFELGVDLNLDISSRDNIIVKVINKENGEIISESNKAWGKYIIGNDEKFGRGDLIKSGVYSIEVSNEDLGGFDIEDVVIHFEVHKEGNSIYSYSYPEDFVKVNIRQVQANPVDFGKLYNFVVKNNTSNISNVEIVGYGRGQDNSYKELHKLQLALNSNEEKVVSIPSNTGIVDLKIITRIGELYNEQELKVDDTFIKLGENGHVGVKSLAPNYEDMGIKYKWELSNINNLVKTNVKIMTKDGKEVLASVDLEPEQIMLIDTLVEKGSTIKVSTMQGDGGYVSKDFTVNDDMIKFNNVDVKNIDVDPNNYGRMLRWKISNKNSSGRTNVIVRDGVGGVISQFDLDYNQENVIDVDVNKGRSIIVETRMGNGSYSSKKYNISNKKEEQHVKVSKVESDVDGVDKYEVENTLPGKTNVVFLSEDELSVIDQFDLNVGEKRFVSINKKYVEKFKVKTLNFDGYYYKRFV